MKILIVGNWRSLIHEEPLKRGLIKNKCVIEEFKWQLPDNAKVIKEDRIVDDRGTRFILIGKYEKNNL